MLKWLMNIEYAYSVENFIYIYINDYIQNIKYKIYPYMISFLEFLIKIISVYVHK